MSRCQKHKEVGFSTTLVPRNLMAVWFSLNHETDYLNVGTVFRDRFQAKFEDCFMTEFIVVNDSLES